MAYKTLPVDEETYQKVQILCTTYDMGKRSQGALIRKLVNAEYEKLATAKLLSLPAIEKSKNESQA